MSRLGDNSLGWIQDSRDNSKQSKQDNNSKQSLHSKHEIKKVGRPKTLTHKIDTSSQEGLKEGWTRATFILRQDLLDKLKDYSYWERVKIKDLVNNVIAEYFTGKSVKKRP